MTINPTLMCIAWYRLQDWNELTIMLPDLKPFSGTYQEWLQRAEKSLRENEGNGRTVIRVVIYPERFRRWCRYQGLDIDAEAHKEFVNEECLRIYRETN